MNNAGNTVTVLLCGVGGQGTILAADLLAKTAIASGLKVKLSEIHGMSQRGGAVTTVVRFGDDVASMVADLGCADHVIAFETTEALRNIAYLKKGGNLCVNDESIAPLPVLTGAAKMPEHPREQLLAYGAVLVPALEIAKAAGNAKSVNVALLGALAAGLGFEEEIWIETIRNRVPAKTVDVNIQAFRDGIEYAKGKRL